MSYDFHAFWGAVAKVCRDSVIVEAMRKFTPQTGRKRKLYGDNA